MSCSIVAVLACRGQKNGGYDPRIRKLGHLTTTRMFGTFCILEDPITLVWGERHRFAILNPDLYSH